MGKTIEEHSCETCKWGEWYRHGYDITMMDDECGGCCSWNNKWKPGEVLEDGKKVVIDGDKTKNVRGNRTKELLDHISALFTKEEVITMLTELQSEIDKQCKIPNNNASAYDWNNGVYACYKAVQQKIEQLKENNE